MEPGSISSATIFGGLVRLSGLAIGMTGQRLLLRKAAPTVETNGCPEEAPGSATAVTRNANF